MGADHDGWPVYRVAGEAAEKAGLDALSYCERRESEVKCWSQRAMRRGWAAVGRLGERREGEAGADTSSRFAATTAKNGTEKRGIVGNHSKNHGGVGPLGRLGIANYIPSGHVL
jgi:hypothetical protein